MFWFKKKTDEQIVNQTKKMIRNRFYYATFFFLFSIVHFSILLFLLNEMYENGLNASKGMTISNLNIDKSIQASDIEWVQKNIEITLLIGVSMGVSICCTCMCGLFYLMDALNVIFPKEKDLLLIKLFEASNQQIDSRS